MKVSSENPTKWGARLVVEKTMQPYYMYFFTVSVIEGQRCSRPIKPVNGTVVGKVKDRYESGDVIMYRCNGGLTLVGSRNATCNNGQWVPYQPPICEGNI